ncbi:hypothetical protein C7N43_11690 [Sphingobacteriales bacterium UPWRP_1]|nr:hypothetical protein B6N25_13450 [Sphingobacteriales bacterium TSM_CSS]PSJ76791.1 hypothetical protein C7N43_11690 [Sphingobacteriales bacterium UPWRP_1]
MPIHCLFFTVKNYLFTINPTQIMKKISLLLATAIVLFALTLTAWLPNTGKPATQVKKLMWLPPNATSVKINDQTTEITGGSKFEYLALDMNGNLLPPVLSATVSCDCTSGSGCSPFSGHGQQGCAMNGCSNCTGSVSVKAPASSGSATLQTMAVSSGGFVLSSARVDFATAVEVKNGAGVFPAMFKSAKIQQELNRFKAPFRNNPDGVTVPVFVSVAGRIAVMEVPAKIALDNKALVLAAKGSCSCTEGSCSYGSSMGIEYCNGSCTGTCSLTTSLKATGNEVAIESYNF